MRTRALHPTLAKGPPTSINTTKCTIYITNITFNAITPRSAALWRDALQVQEALCRRMPPLIQPDALAMLPAARRSELVVYDAHREGFRDFIDPAALEALRVGH